MDWEGHGGGGTAGGSWKGESRGRGDHSINRHPACQVHFLSFWGHGMEHLIGEISWDADNHTERRAGTPLLLGYVASGKLHASLSSVLSSVQQG